MAYSGETRSDKILGIAVAVLGVIMAVMSMAIKINPNQLTLSARFFPLMLSIILICLGLGLAIQKGGPSLSKVIGSITDRQGMAVAAILAGYFLSFRYLDFRLGSWVFMLGMMLVLGARRKWELILVPIAASAGVYSIFRYGFSVILPTWF